MKFGLELQQNIFAPWRLSYISYDVLKKELKNRQLDHGWTEQDEEEFILILDNELTKVYDFINAKLTEIDARILYCERTIQTLQKNPSMASDSNYGIMDEALTEILFDVNDLSKFTRLNFTAIQKLLKKHDKWTHLNLKQTYITKLREKPLDKQRFDVAIIYISALHDICRNHGHQVTGDNAAGGNQYAFERATAKYWIHPDNITEVKAIIMLHLPVLLYDKNKKWEPADSAISSVYFDNSNFDLYTGRLQRDEGAEAIRFRWYGESTNPTVYIERKTHHAAWLDGASVKDSFPLDESQVNAFTVGRRTADDIVNHTKQKQPNIDQTAIDNIQFVAKGVQTSFRERQLQSILRVFYNRTAFQLPEDQRLRISLDTDLTFIREDHLDDIERRKPSYNWRRNDIGIDYPFHQVPEQDILRFPYAVLETKLQTHLGQQPPQWLVSLVESHLVHEVPRFSKYLHGACHFYRTRLPLLPWWLSELNVDIRKPRAENIGLTRSHSFKPLIDGKYRRAMIEEQERANQDAVVNNDEKNINNNYRASTNSNISQRSYTTVIEPSYDLQEPQQQSRMINSSSASSTSPPLSTPKKDYTVVRVPPKPEKTMSIVSNHSQFVNNNSSHHQHQNSITTTTSRIKSKQFDTTRLQDHANNISNKFQSFIGVPVDPTDENDDQPKRAKVKVRVEPKTFFANERTFISWLQFCALLLTVALNLLNFGDNVSRAIGGVFMTLAAAIAIYALYRFEKRAWMINHQIDGRYDDIWGPAVLCLLLVIALIVNFYLRFK
ncbi:unnamed protein product [Cunninghamella echinulata]